MGCDYDALAGPALSTSACHGNVSCIALVVRTADRLRFAPWGSVMSLREPSRGCSRHSGVFSVAAIFSCFAGWHRRRAA